MSTHPTDNGAQRPEKYPRVMYGEGREGPYIDELIRTLKERDQTITALERECDECCPRCKRPYRFAEERENRLCAVCVVDLFPAEQTIATLREQVNKGGAGCADEILALGDANRSLREQLDDAERFILNGVEFGFIRLPNNDDPADRTYQAILTRHAEKGES